MYLFLLALFQACEGRKSVQSVDDTWDVTQDGQQDVDKEVGVAASLKEDTKRWQDDGKNDLADIAVDQCQQCRDEAAIQVIIGAGSSTDAGSLRKCCLRSCEGHLECVGCLTLKPDESMCLRYMCYSVESVAYGICLKQRRRVEETSFIIHDSRQAS